MHGMMLGSKLEITIALAPELIVKHAIPSGLRSEFLPLKIILLTIQI